MSNSARDTSHNIIEVDALIVGAGAAGMAAALVGAIELASKSPGEEAGGEFARINPLIAIMRWWQIHVPDYEKSRGSPESTLVEACRRFLLAHEPGQT